MIVTVANLKGGVGKTTSSVFLAHALAETTGERCVVIDSDPQGSAAQWAKEAVESGHPISVPVLAQPTTRLAKMVNSAPHLVIDTPPAYSDALDAAIQVADFVVIPTSPSAMDLASIRATVDAARRNGKPAAVLLTRTRRTRSIGSAEEALRAGGVRVLHTHIALREAVAMSFGQRVRQLHGYDLVAAELVAAVPQPPRSEDSARRRAVRVPRIERRPLPVISLADAPSPSAQPSIALPEDELVQRLRSTMARLTAGR